MIGCDRAAVLIERRLDGEASPQDDAALDAHVVSCPSCAELLAHETALDAALAARFAGAAPSAAFAAAVRTRIAAERPAPAAWIPDALNAAGFVLSLAVVVPLAAWWGGAERGDGRGVHCRGVSAAAGRLGGRGRTPANRTRPPEHVAIDQASLIGLPVRADS
jgi:anti-sigma factor RsiW